jgi:uncharacterized membrane protein YGL010W
MLQTEKWLGEHADIGASAGNRLLDWICVPLLVIGLVGLLWSLPVPAAFSESSPVLNWGTLFLMAAVVYYFILSISLAFGILPFVMFVAAVIGWLDALGLPLGPICGIVFLVAWSAQLLWRWASGKPLRPIDHLQHLMIGPVWLLASVYRRLGIPY